MNFAIHHHEICDAWSVVDEAHEANSSNDEFNVDEYESDSDDSHIISPVK